MLGRNGYQRSGIIGARNTQDGTAADTLGLGWYDSFSLDKRILTVILHDEVAGSIQPFLLIQVGWRRIGR